MALHRDHNPEITAIGRMLKAKDKKAPLSKPDSTAPAEDPTPAERVVTAKRAA